jgi:predicted branched-subunit amino acid permease
LDLIVDLKTILLTVELSFATTKKLGKNTMTVKRDLPENASYKDKFLKLAALNFYLSLVFGIVLALLSGEVIGYAFGSTVTFWVFGCLIGAISLMLLRNNQKNGLGISTGISLLVISIFFAANLNEILR